MGNRIGLYFFEKALQSFCSAAAYCNGSRQFGLWEGVNSYSIFDDTLSIPQLPDTFEGNILVL